MGFIEEIKKQRVSREEITRDAEPVIEEEQTEAIKKLSSKQETEAKAKQLQEQIYRQAIDNIRITEAERIKINKHDFADKDEVIDILLYALSKAGQDELFYKSNVAKLKGHTPLYK